MLPGFRSRHASLRGADEEPLAHQVRFAYGFHRFRFLSHHRGQRIQPHRATLEITDDGVQHGDVKPVEPLGIDLIQGKRLTYIFGRRLRQVVNDDPVSHAT